jgi:hypothetical protein
VKDRFYEELEHALKQFTKYHLKTWLGELVAKVGREDISKPRKGTKVYTILAHSKVPTKQGWTKGTNCHSCYFRHNISSDT